MFRIGHGWTGELKHSDGGPVDPSAGGDVGARGLGRVAGSQTFAVREHNSGQPDHVGQQVDSDCDIYNQALAAGSSLKRKLFVSTPHSAVKYMPYIRKCCIRNNYVESVWWSDRPAWHCWSMDR